MVIFHSILVKEILQVDRESFELQTKKGEQIFIRIFITHNILYGSKHLLCHTHHFTSCPTFYTIPWSTSPYLTQLSVLSCILSASLQTPTSKCLTSLPIHYLALPHHLLRIIFMLHAHSFKNDRFSSLNKN